ncbi:MAG: nucleotide sugar dehydrogenase [Coriobacteriales bacterium]|nr:nucleotide sugar dehydrogenase [Coriobacteriales bacterium]
MKQFDYDVAIVGTGRVGLPLGLYFAKVGLKCFGVDKNADVIEKINRNEMPFYEPGFDEVIKQVAFEASSDFSRLSNAANIVITVGTPLLAHIEVDLSQIDSLLDSLLPQLRERQCILLRSTVAPETTKYIRNYIELHTNLRIGETIFLAFCPERIVEGQAYEELTSLPQIIGAEDEESFRRAHTVFSRLAPRIFKTNYTSAELVKLFNNVNRYIGFAVSNQFAIIAETLGQNIFDIIQMANEDYPRSRLFAPGLTAGTCLRKDFGMLSEMIPYTDLFLGSWKVNEYMPKFLVERVKELTKITGKTVAVLGYAFKRNSDDARDSLAPKLIRYINREAPRSIKISDHYMGETIEGHTNHELISAVTSVDIVFISINHTEYFSRRSEILAALSDDCVVVDIWNVLGIKKIVFSKEEIN